jgi:hypothetical protein
MGCTSQKTVIKLVSTSEKHCVYILNIPSLASCLWQIVGPILQMEQSGRASQGTGGLQIVKESNELSFVSWQWAQVLHHIEPCYHDAVHLGFHHPALPPSIFFLVQATKHDLLMTEQNMFIHKNCYALWNTSSDGWPHLH